MKKKLLYFLNNAEELIGAALFSVMFLVLVLQIVFRQIFNSPLVWSEELSMMLFVFIALLGVSSEIKDNGHVRLDLIDDKIKGKVKTVIKISIGICTLISIVTFVFVGFELADRKAIIEMVGMGISSVYLYGALPIISLLMLFRFIQRLYIKKGF